MTTSGPREAKVFKLFEMMRHDRIIRYELAPFVVALKIASVTLLRSLP